MFHDFCLQGSLAMKSKFFFFFFNSLAIHIELPQKKWFKRNTEPAHPKLFSEGNAVQSKRLYAIKWLQFAVGYIRYFLQLDVLISGREFSGFRFQNKQPASILNLVLSGTHSHS